MIRYKKKVGLSCLLISVITCCIIGCRSSSDIEFFDLNILSPTRTIYRSVQQNQFIDIIVSAYSSNDLMKIEVYIDDKLDTIYSNVNQLPLYYSRQFITKYEDDHSLKATAYDSKNNTVSKSIIFATENNRQY
jgi:hypothetical protein